MRTVIQSIHFDADRKLLDFIQEKLDKLPQFFDQILDAQVFLKIEKNHNEGNKLVEIKLLVPQSSIITSERARTFEEATDLAVESLKRQVKKYKEKIRVA